jgi:hypothetical protein
MQPFCTELMSPACATAVLRELSPHGNQSGQYKMDENAEEHQINHADMKPTIQSTCCNGVYSPASSQRQRVHEQKMDGGPQRRVRVLL